MNDYSVANEINVTSLEQNQALESRLIPKSQAEWDITCEQ